MEDCTDNVVFGRVIFGNDVLTMVVAIPYFCNDTESMIGACFEMDLAGQKAKSKEFPLVDGDVGELEHVD